MGLAADKGSSRLASVASACVMTSARGMGVGCGGGVGDGERVAVGEGAFCASSDASNEIIAKAVRAMKVRCFISVPEQSGWIEIAGQVAPICNRLASSITNRSYVSFQPFDPHEAVRIYGTTLPHWRQTGATYFVTFRLADSIPRRVVAEWDYERRVWLKARGIGMDRAGQWRTAFEKLSKHDRRSFERDNARKLFRCLDECHGACVLRQPKMAMIVRDALFFFKNQRYELGDFVVMPNHVHLLIAPHAKWELEAVMQSLKRYCARQINAALKHKDTSLWQKSFYDHTVRDEAELQRCREYIRFNPEKARLRIGEFLRSADL